VAVVRVPGLLAAEAGGRRSFDVEAASLRDALRALPVADLLLDEAGTLRPLVHAYVDGERERDLEAPLSPSATVLIVAAVAGG